MIVAIASGALHASAETGLPPRSAAQLLGDMQSDDIPAFEGTIVENASFGLPDLPSTGSGADTSLMGLLTGPHTVRIWYGGPERQRLALLGTVGESDVFHDGTQLWQWDSNTRTATHATLPAGAARQQPSAQQTGALTPQQLAQQALAAIDPTTTVDVDPAVKVANKMAYQLVLQPKDTSSRIGSVRIAVDGQTKLPLRVQVFGRGAGSDPALDVSFTSVTYSQPNPSMFDFTPPAGATVTEMSVGNGAHASATGPAMSEPQALGSGWTSVAFLRLPPASADSSPSGPVQGGSAQGDAGALLNALSPVSGAWGTGRMLDSTLLSALITDDGRVFVGPVDPSVLYADATSHR